jgi:hypothetical protein
MRNRAPKIDFEADIINGAEGLASLQAPLLRINCLSSLWLAFLKEFKDESGYESLGSSRWMKPDAVYLMRAFDE